MAVRSNTLESRIEDHLTQSCQAHGIYQHKNTGRNGIPDRLLIYRSTHWFLELKRPGKRPTSLQEAVARELRAHGAVTLWADSMQAVDDILQCLIGQAPPPRQYLYGLPQNIYRRQA